MTSGGQAKGRLGRPQLEGQVQLSSTLAAPRATACRDFLRVRNLAS